MRREKLFLFASVTLNLVLAWLLVTQVQHQRAATALADKQGQQVEALAQQLREAEASRRSPTTSSAATSDEVRELARLRNEVTRLRNELRAIMTAPPAKAVAAPVKAPLPSPSVVKFTNAVTTTIPIGHALALGGWSEPGTGKRILSFITPETPPDAPGSVMVHTRLMSVPDALLDRLGLQALRAETAVNEGPIIFEAAQFATLFKTMEQTDGTDLLSTPRVLTANGQAAKIAVTQAQPDGTSTGPVIHLTPTLDATGANVRLEVNLELALPAAKQP